MDGSFPFFLAMAIYKNPSQDRVILAVLEKALIRFQSFKVNVAFYNITSFQEEERC